jgi:hypothetical protein
LLAETCSTDDRLLHNHDGLVVFGVDLQSTDDLNPRVSAPARIAMNMRLKVMV